MARLSVSGQNFCVDCSVVEKFLGNTRVRRDVHNRMIRRTTFSQRLQQDHQIHLIGVRVLSRTSFALVMVLAACLNDADQLARAKGLLSVRVEAPTMFFGTHACMQPEAEDLPDEQPPPEPPCPKKAQ